MKKVNLQDYAIFQINDTEKFIAVKRSDSQNESNTYLKCSYVFKLPPIENILGWQFYDDETVLIELSRNKLVEHKSVYEGYGKIC